MTPENWKKVKEILEKALELAEAERGPFLEEQCGGDSELRSEIESLLTADNTRAKMLESDAASNVFAADSSGGRIGDRVGPYEIIGELGTGGMGAVFLAKRADGSFDQTVALKLIKRGMDSDAILKRFVTERQILASLKHPNIAHLIDGGTTDDGLPYFVMEYIDGEPINLYAEREDLNLNARLDLFRDVCSAVSFAHQNLVIHRDLKPSNILITKDGKVKLLDFGIAKLLKTDDALLTATENFIFTPEYASPEQVRGEQLTTATDVYSLGSILYELLSGQRPYATTGKNIGEIIRAVCESEPTAPSRGRRSATSNGADQTTENASARTHPIPVSQLRGDLDNIILKALRKEPERRYSSVEQFSEDIRRHQRGLPVAAVRDTVGYRASKFFRRNRLAVSAAALVLVVLSAGLFATLYQRNKAQRRLNDVRQLANTFIFKIADELDKSPIRAREMLVATAVEYLDKLAVEASDDNELRAELASAYEKIGDVQSQLMRPSLGKTSESLVNHRKALEFRTKLFSHEPTVARAVAVATSNNRVGDISMMTGQIDVSLEKYRHSIETLDPLIVRNEMTPDARNRLANSYSKLAGAIQRSGSISDALRNYERALQMFQELAAENPDKATFDDAVAVTNSFLGSVNVEMGNTDKAVGHYAKSVEIQKRAAAGGVNTGVRHHLSRALTFYGWALSEQGNLAEAILQAGQGVRMQEHIFAEDKQNLGEQSSLADSCLEYGKILAKNGRTAEAIDYLGQAADHYQTIANKDGGNLWTKRRIAVAQRQLGEVYVLKGDYIRALEIYPQTEQVFRNLTDSYPEYAEWQVDLAKNYLGLGEAYLKMGNKSSALLNFEQANAMFEKLSAISPESVKRRQDLEKVRHYLAGLRV